MATKTRGYEVIKWVNSDQSEWSKLQKSTYRQMKNTVKNLEPSNVAAGEGSMIYVSKKNARDFISVNSVLNDLKESGDRYYLLMKAQLHTGARVGDLSSLKLKDIDFEQNVIYIERGKGEGGTGKKKRAAPMSKTLKKELQFLIKENKLKPNSLLFPSPTDISKPVSDNVVLARLNKVLAKKDEFGNHIYDLQAWDQEKTHKFRKAWATMAMQAGLDSNYVQEILGHKDNMMKVLYASDALNPSANIVKNFELLPEQADILDTHLDYQRKLYEYERAYQKHLEVNENIKVLKRKNKTIDQKLLDQEFDAIDQATDDKVSKFTKTSRYKQSGRQFNQKFAPDPEVVSIDDQIDRLRQIEAGVSPDKIEVKIPKDAQERPIGDFPDFDTKEKIDRARMGNWKKAPIAQAAFDKKQTDAIDAMYDMESQTKLKKDIILDENTATRAVEESIDAFDFTRYKKNTDNMRLNLQDDAKLYRYDAGNLLDWDSSDWSNDSKGLDEIFQGNKFLGNRGAELKLDAKVVDDMFFHLEEASRFDYLTKRIIDQLDYMQYPPNVAKTGAERFKYQKIMIEEALDNFLKTKQGQKFAVGYSSMLRRDLNLREIVDRIAVSIQPIGDNKEYSHISSDFLRSVVKNNPDIFPEVSDRLKKIYPEEVLNRMRLEPYLQFFNEQGLIDDTVYFAEEQVLKDGDLDTPLKEKIKFKGDGTVDLRTSKPFVPEIRSTAFDTVFQYSYPEPSTQVVATGLDRTAIRSAVILPDIPDVNLQTEGADFVLPKTKGGYKPTDEHKYVKLLTQGAKTFGKGSLKVLPFIVPFWGSGAKAGSVALEAGLELGTRAYFADMSSLGEGALGDSLVTPIDDIFMPSADRKEVRKQLDNLSSEEVAKVVGKTQAPEEEVGTGEIYAEKGRDILRNMAAVGALSTGDPDFFGETVKEVDEAERKGAAPDIVERVTGEEVSKYVSDKRDTLNRRRESAQRLMDQYGGTIITDKIRDPRLEDIETAIEAEGEEDLQAVKDITAQMGNLNLSTNQEGENDAVNARLQTR